MHCSALTNKSHPGWDSITEWADSPRESLGSMWVNRGFLRLPHRKKEISLGVFGIHVFVLFFEEGVGPHLLVSTSRRVDFKSI